jgi:hypothetical protein
MKCGFYDLKIDDEFKRFTLPLTSEEYEQLEANIKIIGCREPLIVWNKTIIDGHNRYEICNRLKIPFSIKYVVLHSREQVLAWICTNQLKRKNIGIETRRYLIGKKYNLEKILGAHMVAGTDHYVRRELKPYKYFGSKFDDSVCKTKERFGKEFCVSTATVARYGDFAQAVDNITEIEPAFLLAVLSGQLKITHNQVVELSELLPEEIHRISTELLTKRFNASTPKKMLKTSIPKKISENVEYSFQVKTLPKYDPDAEILGLAFTIPSWISSIKRVRTMVKPIELSENARSRLNEKLKCLKIEVENMISKLEEKD